MVEQWKHKLSQVFNRGFWDGYYLGQKLGEWSTQYGSSATKIKHLLGKCTNYFSNIGVAEFTMQSGELHIGNDVLIIGKTTGVVECTVDEIRYNLQPVSVVKKGDVFSMKVPQLVRRGDVLYLWKDSDK